MNKWDLEEIDNAGEMLKMKTDYETAYSSFLEKELEKKK